MAVESPLIRASSVEATEFLDLSRKYRVTFFGAGAAFFANCMKAGVELGFYKLGDLLVRFSIEDLWRAAHAEVDVGAFVAELARVNPAVAARVKPEVEPPES